MSFSDQLKKRKNDSGKTLADISTVTGMQGSHVSKVLNGKTDAQASTLESLAHALDGQWMLIPRHLLPEVERLLSGKSIGPDNVPSTVDRLFGRHSHE